MALACPKHEEKNVLPKSTKPLHKVRATERRQHSRFPRSAVLIPGFPTPAITRLNIRIIAAVHDGILSLSNLNRAIMVSYSPGPENITPDQQLRTTLHSSITRSLTSHRPLLTHLNADTTWLLSLPYPANTMNPRSRTFFHILIDPWLAGSQSDVAKFFSQQWHATESSAQSIVAVETLIKDVERAASGFFEEDTSFSPPPRPDEPPEPEEQWLDVVVVSHEFTDHMHKDTLLEVRPSTPVFATSKAAGIVRSWGHFENVIDVERFTGDWRTNRHKLLPDWCSVSRVAYDGPDLLYYHSAIMVSFYAGQSWRPKGKDEAEAVIYTPHGIDPENLAILVQAEPEIQTLALLHGLQDIQISSGWAKSVKAQLNKGAHNGLKVQRMLKSRYWIGTHDEVKRGGGIVSWFLDRNIISVQDAITQEKSSIEEEEGQDMELGDVRFIDLGNGESLLLR